MDLNDEVIQSFDDLNNYGERVYGSIGYVSFLTYNELVNDAKFRHNG